MAAGTPNKGNCMSDSTTQDQLRRLVDEALLVGQEKSICDLLQTIMRRGKKMGLHVDTTSLLEYWWGLARTGIVAILGEDSDSVVYGERIPQWQLTERGRRLLEHGEKSPHNPSKYLAAVRDRVSQPDDVALSYLAEAVEAWRCGLNRSSAVMLGCACERLVLLLAEVISADAKLPGSDKIGKAIEGRVFVSPLFEEIRSTLTCLKKDKKLPKDLGDALDRKLSAIFDHARGLRNESGHPTSEEVSAEDAEAGLLLFPGFYELVDRLIAGLPGLGPTETS